MGGGEWQAKQSKGSNKSEHWLYRDKCIKNFEKCVKLRLS